MSDDQCARVIGSDNQNDADNDCETGADPVGGGGEEEKDGDGAKDGDDAVCRLHIATRVGVSDSDASNRCFCSDFFPFFSDAPFA